MTHLPRSSALIRMAWLFLALFVPALAQAQADPPSAAGAGGSEATAAPASDEATVRFYNRDIVTLRGDFLGRPAHVRATTAMANIQRIVEKPGVPVVAFEEQPQGTVVLLDGEMVMALTDEDLDKLHGQTMAEAKAALHGRLSEAVATAERDAVPANLLNGALWSLGGTAIAVLVGLGILWLVRRARQRLKQWISGRSKAAADEPAGQLARALGIVGDWVLRILVVVLMLLLLEEWLRFVLGQFGFSRPWSEAMTTWIRGRLLAWATAIASAIPGLVTAVVIFLAARFVANTTSMIFRGVARGRFELFGIDHELAEPTRKLVVAAIWLFAVAMAYPYLPGAETEAFKGLSVLVGLMVSLGASGIIGQAAGGFTILYSRTMSIGDYVRSGDIEGTVQQIGLFTTRLRTITGVEVSIPNNVVLGSQLQNYSRHPEGPGLWLETAVTIGYDAPWRQVQRMLLEAAAQTDGIRSEPKPFVLQTALSDYYVEYLLRARIDDALQRPAILTRLHGNIQDAFNREGVQIMSPHYIADPELAKVVPPSLWEGLPPPANGPASGNAPDRDA